MTLNLVLKYIEIKFGDHFVDTPLLYIGSISIVDS